MQASHGLRCQRFCATVLERWDFAWRELIGSMDGLLVLFGCLAAAGKLGTDDALLATFDSGSLGI